MTTSRFLLLTEAIGTLAHPEVLTPPAGPQAVKVYDFTSTKDVEPSR